MTPIDTWRVRAPAQPSRARRRRSSPQRLDVLLGGALLVVEIAWVAAVVWALSLIF